MKDGKPTDYSKYSLRYSFSSKIVCGYCGAIFTRKMGRAKQDDFIFGVYHKLLKKEKIKKLSK